MKDFIHRQVKLTFVKILKGNPKSESLNNLLCFHLQKLFKFIDIQALPIKLDDEEWDTIAKLFIKCIEELVDSDDEDTLCFIKGIELDEKQQISLSLFKDVKF